MEDQGSRGVAIRMGDKLQKHQESIVEDYSEGIRDPKFPQNDSLAIDQSVMSNKQTQLY